MKNQIILIALMGGLFAGCATRPVAPKDDFADWPAGATPEEIGKRVAENFVARKLRHETNADKEVHYAEACTWYGALTVAQLTDDAALQAALIKKFEPLFTTDANAIPSRHHVDDRVFGIAPLEIFIQTNDKKYLALGKGLADAQWAQTTPDGITAEARYWIDDMYMITALQVQTFRATGETKYLDRAALTMSAYLDKLQQPNGLFFHGTNSPFFWSRGDGWMAAGMTELLRSLPKNHPQRARIMAGYKKMLATLLKYQGEDGLWHQLIDHPEAWSETSGTAMFTFAMITGVKNGWLDADAYGPAARKAWLGLVKHLDANANVDKVCIGTGKGTSVEYYLARPRIAGDFHGQAPILWSASALLREPKQSAQ
ncbi:MAG: glycoside hydrolase family 88 protein [Limisphaerales bacterium]